MIDRAAKFAEQAHKGAHRKGTRIPYIVHPLETALIASMLTKRHFCMIRSRTRV